MNIRTVKLQLEKLLYMVRNKQNNNCQIINNLNTILKNVNQIINPCCNLKNLGSLTDGFTKINGENVPGTMAGLVNSVVLLNITNAQGQRVKIIKSIRKAGTRVGIHVHKYGGYTLILDGEMTDYVQGKAIQKYGPNSGYYMPPCTPMSAANLGNKDVTLIDIFIGQPGEPFIEVLEPGWPGERIGRFDGV